MSLRNPVLFALLILAVLTVSSRSEVVPLSVEQTRNGCLLSDNFNDGIMDTSSYALDYTPWQPMYGDSTLDFREINGYFQVYGNTGPVSLGQHRGIESNPNTYDNWEIASLESLELVSLVDMWNLDPFTPGEDELGFPAVARMTNHYCSNCNLSGIDNNATVSVGYLLGEGTGPGWNPAAPKWGYRVKWNTWFDRYLTDTDSLFGGEENGFVPTMVDNYGFDLFDSTLTTGYVYHGGEWIVVGSLTLDLSTCRKTELKSMCENARNHDVDFRWDNFRLFPNSKRWPARFQLLGGDSLKLAGDYVLGVYRVDTDSLVGLDTLDALSEFAIYLDHTELVIPQSLRLVLYENFVDSAAVAFLGATEVNGCYPDDAYNIYYDTANVATAVAGPPALSEQGIALDQSQPNPWNPETRIPYEISAGRGAVDVTLKVYDISGRLVRTLVNEPVPTGGHSARWDGRDESGSDVASGIYLYRLQAGGEILTKRMILLR